MTDEELIAQMKIWSDEAMAKLFEEFDKNPAPTINAGIKGRYVGEGIAYSRVADLLRAQKIPEQKQPNTEPKHKRGTDQT